MRFIEDIVDGLSYIGSVFHAFADKIPTPSIPLIGGLLDWIQDRIDDVGDAFEWLGDRWDDADNWFSLVHDLVQYVFDFTDIEDWLKDLWQIPDLSISWISFKALDALKWMLATSEDFADQIAELLKPALKKIAPLFDLSAQGIEWLIEEVVFDLIDEGTDLAGKVISLVWNSISDSGSVLEDWLVDKGNWLIDDVLHLGTWFADAILDSADWVINEGLRLGDWLVDQIDAATDWVSGLLDKAFWQMLDFIVNMPDTFIGLVLDAFTATYQTFADRIIDLAELVLDFVWGDGDA